MINFVLTLCFLPSYSPEGSLTKGSEAMLKDDEHMCKMIASMRTLRCNYTFHADMESYSYESISQLLMLSA